MLPPIAITMAGIREAERLREAGDDVAAGVLLDLVDAVHQLERSNLELRRQVELALSSGRDRPARIQG